MRLMVESKRDLMRYMNVVHTVLLLLSSMLWGQYGTYNVPAGSPMANGEHPRLFFTESTFPSIASYIETYESTDFQTWLNARDADFDESPSSKERRMLLWEACNYAFLYYALDSGLFSSFTFGHSTTEYADKVYDHIIEIDNRVRNQGMREFRGGITGNQGGYITMTTALAYDWIFDYWTQSQKEFMADLSIFMNTQETNARCFPDEGMNLGNDWNSQCWEVGFWGGAAMYGDDLGASRTADINRLKDVIQWFVFDQVFDVQDIVHEGTAANGEGGNYYGVTLGQQTFQASGLGPALGMDFCQEYGSIHDAAWFYWNLGLPRRFDNGATAGWIKHRFDDAWLSGWGGRGHQTNMTPIISLLKASDPDHAAAMHWLVTDGRGGIGTTDPIDDVLEKEIFWLWFKFLWGYKDVAKLTPEEYGLSKTNRFGMGETIMYSDFDTEDATKILFYQHEWFVNLHHHDDYGGFEVFKNGLLAVNNGGNWKSTRVLDIDPPETTDPSSPIFHNIMAIHTGSNAFYFNQANTTPDNDTPTHVANQAGGQNNIGEVLAEKSLEDVYDYFDYDYTRTYKGETFMDLIRRKMVYFRDPAAPDYSNSEEYLIIYDNIDMTTNHTRRWLMRTVYEPVTMDGSWSTQSSSYKTTSNTTEFEVTNTYANNNGRMYVKVLEPEDITVGLRGSPSSPYLDANGGSMSLGGNINEAARNFTGTYRMEVEHNTSSTDSDYLVAMQIGTATNLTTMASMEKIDTGDFLGAFLNGNRVVFFNTTTTDLNALTYTITAAGSVRHVVTGLEPGAYFVRQDGVTVPGVDSIVDENGSLYFESSGGGGTFVISKSSDITAPNTPTNVRVTK